jgi:hypothetical protein
VKWFDVLDSFILDSLKQRPEVERNRVRYVRAKARRAQYLESRGTMKEG